MAPEPYLHETELDYDLKGSRGDMLMTFFTAPPSVPDSNHTDLPFTSPTEGIAEEREEDLHEKESQR